MDIAVIILLVVLTGMVFMLFMTRREDPKERSRQKETIESLLNEKFLDFSDRIRTTMDKTREEVERSKDLLSKNAVRTLEHISSMNNVVNDLVKQQEKAQQLGQSLEYLLQTPKLRGNYGETVLEEMLEKVLPKGIWERQFPMESGERVDAVVRYRDVIVPIDAKFPKEDYQKYLSAGDPGSKKAHWTNYEKALKLQINQIKDKYIHPEKGTTEFALLFIPSESIYYETIAEKNHLGDPCHIYEYATSRKVIPVSPNTFYAFLHVVMLGVRNIEIAKEARKLQGSLVKLERDFGYFYKKYEVVGKALEKAHESYMKGDDHILRFKRNLDNTIKMDTSFGDVEDQSDGTVPSLAKEGSSREDR